ncbi:autoinducer binding domain-containing protein [Izhakiella australiensis]|uniref:autoinducer binding domain-containing protein n=1 Tax=Izhakiella australiensis TaxID=1926881 RepID=UPI00098FC60C|nr:autoinducer binding domain-containing protein [Izhakiella australiensis]
MYFSNPDINALIKLLLDKEITICGEVKYAYAVMNKSFPKEMIIINNHDSWFNKYLQGEYQLFDPVIIKSLNRVEDFYWGKDILYHQDRGGDNIFNAGEGYSIDNGHTFVLHDNVNNLAVLSVFPGENNRDDFRAMI